MALFGWLDDNKVKYAPVDQNKRAEFYDGKIKSFDLIIQPEKGKKILAEVKGRKFSGTDITKSSLQCWVTLEDVKGLAGWQKIFGDDFLPYLIFVYDIEKLDVETDIFEIYPYRNKNFVFIMISLDDFAADMAIRSPKWKTMTLSSIIFRKKSKGIGTLLKQKFCDKTTIDESC